MSDQPSAAPFGPLRTVVVALAGLVLVGSLVLQLVAREILWGPMLTALGMVVLVGGHLAAWRPERKRRREQDQD